MRNRTEDLLTIRDGEPMDAAERARLLADPESMREIERLERLRSALRELPPLEPPPGVWERIAECSAAEAPPRRAVRRPLAASAAAAAMLAAIALWLVLAAPDGSRDFAAPGAATPGGTVAAGPDRGAGRKGDAERRADRAPERSSDGGAERGEDRGEHVAASPGTDGGAMRRAAAAAENGADPTAPTFAPAFAPATYESLLAESARLERMLSRLDERPGPITVGTASTIVDLEDRVALLDEQLSFAAARGADPEQKQALWRERVDVMNALVHVRYAQFQRIDY